MYTTVSIFSIYLTIAFLETNSKSCTISSEKHLKTKCKVRSQQRFRPKEKKAIVELYIGSKQKVYIYIVTPRLNKSPTTFSRYHTVVEGLKKLVF